MVEQTVPIQVEESEQLAAEEEGEKMQDRDLAQQIQQLIEVMDMELGQEPQDQDIDIMPKAPEVNPQSPPPPIS